MDIIKVSQKIEEKVKLLEKARSLLEGLAADKAVTAANYEKELAITLIKLRNGVAFTLEGEIIREPPATICEKIARGIVWESSLQAQQAEMAYKLGLVKLESVKVELQGFQSIYRHLENF